VLSHVRGKSIILIGVKALASRGYRGGFFFTYTEFNLNRGRTFQRLASRSFVFKNRSDDRTGLDDITILWLDIVPSECNEIKNRNKELPKNLFYFFVSRFS